jgi:hypothetical protein
MTILCIESLCPRKTHTRTLLFGGIHLKHVRHFDYWNQSLNMHMRVCYLHSHEDGLCCYLVIHIEDLLRPLQSFYLHLWPIYWLSLVYVYRYIYNYTRIYYNERSWSVRMSGNEKKFPWRILMRFSACDYNIAPCYATEDAVRIVNSFITIPITRNYNYSQLFLTLLRVYTITILHVRN